MAPRRPWHETPHPLSAAWATDPRVAPWIQRYWAGDAAARERGIRPEYYAWVVTQEDADYFRFLVNQESERLLDHMAKIPDPREKPEHAEAARTNCAVERREFLLLLGVAAKIISTRTLENAGWIRRSRLTPEMISPRTTGTGDPEEMQAGVIFQAAFLALVQDERHAHYDRVRSFAVVRTEKFKKLRRKYDQSDRAKKKRDLRRSDPTVLAREAEQKRALRAARREKFAVDKREEAAEYAARNMSTAPVRIPGEH